MLTLTEFEQLIIDLKEYPAGIDRRAWGTGPLRLTQASAAVAVYAADPDVLTYG